MAQRCSNYLQQHPRMIIMVVPDRYVSYRTSPIQIHYLVRTAFHVGCVRQIPKHAHPDPDFPLLRRIHYDYGNIERLLSLPGDRCYALDGLHSTVCTHRVILNGIRGLGTERWITVFYLLAQHA